MSNVIQAWTWTLHVVSEDNEWDAACGAPEPEMVVEGTGPHLPAYTICRACREVVDKRS